ncbi:NAC domain-containing protein [Sulfurisphaera ohwakuensis]|uniref:NACalpha-BTF3-like transcription factor n=1 Tax=Sulfurisphaera ohwakuensis TaxID=69656 RepID=A0A650CDY2_SULOH|nr:NAC domain-containing protein [Sulfurisphaera ohwakuensis]MBB5253089.1 NACalpha-BTF3-like transcription factor [Sulfurisphaera ohwakuensis]QGR15989.1 hypothetical protein D1869_01420 [Sulfurisphaera ohwakuensis]
MTIDISKILGAKGINAESLSGIMKITIETDKGEKIILTNPNVSKVSFLGFDILVIIEERKD